MGDFKKIKKLAKEIVDEIEIKEVVENGVEKTKKFVDKTSKKFNTYVDAIKSVKEQEYFEKQHPLCLKTLENLEGKTLRITIWDIDDLRFTTDVVSHFEDCHDFCAEIYYVVEKSIKSIVKKEVVRYKEMYGEKVFDIATFDFIIHFDESTLKNLYTIAKKIVVGNEDVVKLGYTNTKMDLSSNVTIKKVTLKKENIRKRILNDVIILDVKNGEDVFSIKLKDIFIVDAINSLLNGTYNFIDMLYAKREISDLVVEDCVIIKAN